MESKNCMSDSIVGWCGCDGQGRPGRLVNPESRTPSSRCCDGDITGICPRTPLGTTLRKTDGARAPMAVRLQALVRASPDQERFHGSDASIVCRASRAALNTEAWAVTAAVNSTARTTRLLAQIGRASCRERV